MLYFKNREFLAALMYSLCSMAVWEPAEKKPQMPQQREKECGVQNGIAGQCLRHEKNYSSYLWSYAHVPLCIQLLFTFFYLLMQPFVSLSNAVAEKK